MSAYVSIRLNLRVDVLVHLLRGLLLRHYLYFCTSKAHTFCTSKANKLSTFCVFSAAFSCVSICTFVLVKHVLFVPVY